MNRKTGIRKTDLRKTNMGSTDPLLTILTEHFGSPRNIRRGVEVGVHRGETSARLLQHFPNLHLLMVDPWTVYGPNHPYRKSGDGCAKFSQAEQDENMHLADVNTQFAAHRRMICRDESADAAEKRRFSSEPHFDFVFLDGDHTYEGVKADINAWWDLVRDGGVLAGHDLDHVRDRKGIWGVRRAVEEFTRENGLAWMAEGELWWIGKVGK